MERKLLYRLLLVLLVISITIIYLGRSRELNVKNFSLIESGMTQAQVESLLGGPPGRYGNSTGQGSMTMEGHFFPSQQKTTVKKWNDKTHWFEVYFDSDGRVVKAYKRFSYSEDEDREGFISRTWKSFCSALGF